MGFQHAAVSRMQTHNALCVMHACMRASMIHMGEPADATPCHATPRGYHMHWQHWLASRPQALKGQSHTFIAQRIMQGSGGGRDRVGQGRPGPAPCSCRFLWLPVPSRRTGACNCRGACEHARAAQERWLHGTTKCEHGRARCYWRVHRDTQALCWMQRPWIRLHVALTAADAGSGQGLCLHKTHHWWKESHL